MPSKHRGNTAAGARIVHPLFRALILTGFAVLIVYLVRTGNIGLYIAPRMEIYVKLSALGLYAAAVYQFYAVIRAWSGRESAPDCDCGHEPSPGVLKHVPLYGLFVLPLALGFLMPDTTMGSSLAAKKGVAFSSSEQLGASVAPVELAPDQGLSDQDKGNLDALFPADEYTASYAAHAKELYVKQSVIVPEAYYIETLTTLDLYRDRLEGMRVEITGFVYREPAMADNRFAVSRFAMNCCSADAMPYGMIVDFPNASHYASDEWLKVTGTMKLGSYNDYEVMTLQATAIERIEAPDTPYVYPNFDFGLEPSQ